MNRKRAQRMAERERTVGLDPADDAAQWLAEHVPEPEPQRPKAASKSKTLHRFRQAQRKKS